MDDIIDMLQGVDKKNEIFNLWYEITFLRLVFSYIVGKSTEMQNLLTKDVIEECRKQAQTVVQERFPSIKIDFSEPSPEQKEKKEKHIDNLKFMNKLLGLSTGENGQVNPCCIHPDSSDTQPVSHPPVNEA
jgi:hypothetical protein